MRFHGPCGSLAICRVLVALCLKGFVVEDGVRLFKGEQGEGAFRAINPRRAYRENA